LSIRGAPKGPEIFCRIFAHPFRSSTAYAMALHGHPARENSPCWRQVELSGFVAHDLSGSCFTCMGGEHEADGVATGDPDETISGSV
jgi:hypothetical protein